MENSQTYEQIQAQIAGLQKQAEAARKQEVSAAVKEAKRLIVAYKLTAADVGLAATVKTPKAAKTKTGKPTKMAKAPKVKKTGDKRAAVAPKYRDGAGNSWTGRGKKPTWLANALAAGAAIDSFKI